MHGINFLGFAALAAFTVATGATRTTPQINLYIGAAPDCPYGYYDYAPYNCGPDGYYGPEWFRGGVFIGAGPWFHGSDDFQGLVDNTLDPQYGYHGPLPEVGDKPAAQRRAAELFNGNEVRDGQVTYPSKAWAARRSISHRPSLRTVERLNTPGQR